MIGALVGVVIVYQVLATDVADHLKKYATFKAIIYRQRFFLSTVFEKAVILALLGFVPGSAILLGIYALVERFTGLPIAVSVGRLVFVLLGAIAMCMVWHHRYTAPVTGRAGRAVLNMDGPAIAVADFNHASGAGEGRWQVLSSSDLDVAPGQLVVLVGASGLGKTTLLTLLGCLRKVQEGTVPRSGSKSRQRRSAATAVAPWWRC